jgi:LacI family transcriptional regulator, gluconate utilization system Gnt-I transcriptional repressor
MATLSTTLANPAAPEEPREGANARMADVARLAEVSAMTVSRALRDPALVSKDTHERIVKAMQALNYVPNKVAGSLRSQRSELVACVVPSLRNSIYSATLQGISDGLQDTGLKLVAGSSGFSGETVAELARELLSLRPRGLVVYERIEDAAVRHALRDAGVPVVEVGDLQPRPDVWTVSFSNRDAARTLTRHLLDRGRRAIGVLTLSPERSARAAARLEGYRAALKQARVRWNPDLVVECEGGVSNGARAFETLLQRVPQLDAVIGLGDVLAPGALLACQRLGVPCPQQVAIASFDDGDLLTELRPTVTALRIPRYEIGRAAARMLARGDAQGERVLDLGFSLVVREST